MRKKRSVLASVGSVTRSMVLALLSVVLSTTGGQALWSQSFRGEVAERFEILDGSTIEAGIEAGRVILLDFSDRFPYVESLELRVTPPEGTTIPTGAFSLHVYEAVDPVSTTTSGFVTIAGRAVGTEPLRPSSSYIVPVTTRYPDRFRQIDEDGTFRAINPSLGMVAIQLVPAMKGMTTGMEALPFVVTITPHLAAVGGVVVQVTGEPDVRDRSHELLRLTINGQPIDEGSIAFFSPGIYRLEAVAGDYLNHAENVGIDAAQTTTRTYTVREPRAFLQIRVPTVAEVFLDGTRIGGVGREFLEYPPGSYVLLIRLGDFAISRRVTFEANKEYQIGLDLDILIKQN